MYKLPDESTATLIGLNNWGIRSRPVVAAKALRPISCHGCNDVRALVSAWSSWRSAGELIWSERAWDIVHSISRSDVGDRQEGLQAALVLPTEAETLMDDFTAFHHSLLSGKLERSPHFALGLI